jgi:hypothetical protein
MKNLNNTILVLILVFSGISLSAQGPGPGRERIKTLKIAYLTEQLSLSSKEAQKFWPVYNAHEEKLEEFRMQERKQFGGRFANLEALTDEEAEKMLSSFIEKQAEKRKIEAEYLKNLKGVIPAKKIIQLFKAEDNFKKRLLQQYRKRRN